MSVLTIQNLAATLRGGFCLTMDRWQADAGQLHALVGCNGAGKSTLLRVITGELAVTGTVQLHGRELYDWPGDERARHLALLPQSSELNFAFKAREVVALGLTPLTLGWREAQREIRRVMSLTDCLELADRPYPRLSGGQQQRVHLARVLLQLSQAEHPPALLLDEPTSAQDLGQQHRILSLAQALCAEQDYAVIAVLHDSNHALRYADCVSLMDQGRLIDIDEPGTVITPESIAHYWQYQARVATDQDGIRIIA